MKSATVSVPAPLAQVNPQRRVSRNRARILFAHIKLAIALSGVRKELN